MPKARTAAKAAAPEPAPAPAEPPPAAEAAAFALLASAQIWVGSLNPRKQFDDEGLAELADSIAAEDLLQPLLVRPGAPDDGDDGASHQLVAGERRLRAIRRLIDDGRWPADKPIPCHVQAIDDETHALRALVENLQRRDLKPLEEAEALKRLIEASAMGTAEIAARIGFTQRFVQQRLQLLELDEGDKARLAEGRLTIQQARQRLANRPKLRDDLTPAHWLILLEIADLAERTGKGHCASVEVGPQIREDAAWQALTDAPGYLCYGPSPVWDAGFETGRFTASISSYSGYEQLELKFPEAFKSDEAMQLALAEARGAAGVEYPLGFEPGRYATPWLNGPWEVAPEVLARIEQAKADRARQEAEAAEHQRAQAARIDAAADVATSLLAEHRARELTPLDDRVPETWAALGFALPFVVDAMGAILDARGRHFQHASYGGRVPAGYLAQRRLTALALNAAAGLHTPDPPAEAEDETPPRAEFVRWVAGCLAEDLEISDVAAAAMAERGLAAYLAGEGMEYGDPAYAWDFEAAMAVAEHFRVEDLGEAADDDTQIDLEDAIAAAGDAPAAEAEPAAACDDGLSPALLAVAGVRSPAPAPAP